MVPIQIFKKEWYSPSIPTNTEFDFQQKGETPLHINVIPALTANFHFHHRLDLNAKANVSTKFVSALLISFLFRMEPQL
jgi:hypothetical protein